MFLLELKWFLLLIVAHVVYCGINEGEILVSITIDAGNEEIVNEGILSFRSIMMFGEKLKNSHFDICIIYKTPEHILHQEQDSHILQSLSSIYQKYSSVEGSDPKSNKLHLRYIHNSTYFPNSEYSPTINKICSFEAPSLYVDRYPEIKYFLYIDADFFLLKDPIESIEREFFSSNFLPKADILCSLPWSTFTELSLFPEFVQFLPHEPKDQTRSHYSILQDLFTAIQFPELSNFTEQRLLTNNPDYPFMKTINPGGMTFHGLCNTGFFFMPIELSIQLYLTSLRYLAIINDFPLSVARNSEEAVWLSSFYSTKNEIRMIDSLILWASIMYLEYQTIVSSIELNYIIPAANYLTPFVTQRIALDNESIIPSEPHFLHFSLGSSFTFSNCECDRQLEHTNKNNNNGEDPTNNNHSNSCQIKLVTNGVESNYSDNMITSNHTSSFFLPYFIFEHYIVPKIVSFCGD